jgi:hypothetical protein
MKKYGCPKYISFTLVHFDRYSRLRTKSGVQDYWEFLRFISLAME